jgi:DNA-binding transcriptional regulator LsrR (DeoR family)
MSNTVQDQDNRRIMLELLQSVERDGGQSQRRLAAELGIALGLVNAYLKRCIKKGLVKVRHVPTRRYACYPTSQGFAKNPASRFNICQIPSCSSPLPPYRWRSIVIENST